MIHLESLTVRDFSEHDANEFQFYSEVIKSRREIKFRSPVTCFLGEHGSGKSTLIEVLAYAANSISFRSKSAKTDQTLATVRDLWQYFRLAWRKRTHKGFFLRAEDFFGYTKKMRQTQERRKFSVQDGRAFPSHRGFSRSDHFEFRRRADSRSKI